MKVGLEGMRTLCERLGHPERSFRSVLVAGTNGKGGTTSALAALLQAHDVGPVGLYTSPHLVSVQERISVQQQWIPADQLAQCLRQIREVSEGLSPTFFEVMTAAAWLYFRECGVQWAVIEVGLGGRLDSTNCLEPEISAITSIGLDHVEILGSDPVGILGEKFGVARAHQPLISAVLQPELRAELGRLAQQKNVSLIELDGDLAALGGWTTADLQTKIPGYPSYQWRNSALALLLAQQCLGSNLDLARAQKVLKNHVWPGRMHTLRWGGGQVLLDGAHNEAGAQALASALCAQGLKSVPIVVGMVGDKDSVAWFKEMECVASDFALCRGASDRFRTPQELQKDCRVKPSQIWSHWREALQEALGRSPVVVLSGSLYLVGEVIEYLRFECEELAAFRSLDPFTNERAQRPK